MPALFQPEITTLESQVVALQAQIAAAQERISLLAEAEFVADTALQGLQSAVAFVQSLAPGAIANLKSAVLNLFQSGDNPNDGNQPNPEPQPNDDGGCEMTPMGAESVDAITVEPLAGQHCEWASPLATPFAPPLATPLCCHLEDAPHSVLAGQSMEIACVVSDAPKKPEYIELVPVSHEVAYQRRVHDGEIICCYVGFNDKTKAKQWGEFLQGTHSVAAGFQLRNSERLTAFKWEIKLWGMSLKQIEKLAESDLQKSPPSNFGTFPVRKIEPVAPLPKTLQIEDIEVGDIVRNTTVKNWTYVVLAKMENGMLDCQRNNTPVGTPEIRLAVHPASVELVSRANKTEDSATPQATSIDIKDVPVGVRLERTNDTLLTEYRVWAWTLVRVFGRLEMQQKSLGTLTETTDGISARRPHGTATAQNFQRTFDAIKYLMQGASLKLADVAAAYQQHQSETAIAAIPEVTSEQAKADLFGGGYDVPALADAFGGFSF